MALPEAKSPSRLILNARIQNEFVTEGSNAIDAVSVSEWRTTLQIGFHNAWPAAGKSGNTLELLTADLAFAPAAVNVRGGAVAVVAQIRYKARVLDSNGQELTVVAGNVEARQAITSKDELSDNAAMAVEALYEKLASEALAK